jgi:hypothetical protein
MPSQPIPEPITPIFRLVVTASQLKAKQFVWVIVDDTTQRRTPVQTSKATFRSLEDAYNAGRGALEYWQRKTRRIVPPVDLAQPPPVKPPVQKAPVPRGPRRPATSQHLLARLTMPNEFEER